MSWIDEYREAEEKKEAARNRNRQRCARFRAEAKAGTTLEEWDRRKRLTEFPLTKIGWVIRLSTPLGEQYVLPTLNGYSLTPLLRSSKVYDTARGAKKALSILAKNQGWIYDKAEFLYHGGGEVLQTEDEVKNKACAPR